MNNKRIALLMACCLTAGLISACENEPECVGNTRYCKNGAVYACNDGILTIEVQCGGDTPFCDADTLKCVGHSLCTNGMAVCGENTLKVCQGGEWVTTPCGTQICNAMTQKCEDAPLPTCTPGCTNGQLTTCDANHKPVISSCDYGCNALGTACGEKPAECDAGETKCLNDLLYSCVLGEWNSGEACHQGEICGLNAQEKEECIESTSEITQCKPYADDASSASQVLSNGDVKCIGNKVVSCTIAEGATTAPDVTIQDCTQLGDHFCDASSGTPACVEDLQTPCDLNGTKLSHNESTCSADKDVVVCHDGTIETTKCDADAPCADVNGKFECHVKSATDCENPDGGIITDATGLCVGNVYKWCDNSKLEDKAVCEGATPVCDATLDGHCRAKLDCDGIPSDEYSCNSDNTAIVHCDDGKLDTVLACVSPEVCQANAESSNGFVCLSEAPGYTTIKALKADYDKIKEAGKDGLSCTISLKGVVTATRGSGQNLFFQDGNSVASDQAAGIYIYNSAKDLTGFNDGDNISVVSSKAAVYNGQLEIIDAVVTKTDATDTVTAIDVVDISTVLETTEEAKNAMNLMLVTLKNVTSEDGKTIKDADEHVINVSTYIAKGLVKADTTFRYDITGIINYNKSANSTVESANAIAPRYASDLVAVGCIKADDIFTPATDSSEAICKAPFDDKYCSQNETSTSCKIIDEHVWRVICDKGNNITEGNGSKDCTAQNMICVDSGTEADCAICSAQNVTLCTENIPEHAVHYCDLSGTPACSWQCEDDYNINPEKTGCVPKCTVDVCDGTKIQVCDKSTGVLTSAQNCTGSDVNGIYACSEGACALSDCQSGFHIDNGACVANCTADVCDGAKIRICNKQTGVLAAAADCTGSDSNGVYTCSEGACGLSSCQNGFHIENGACVANCTADVCDGTKIRICNKQTGVLAAASNCTGSDSNAVYACSEGACGMTGCQNGYHNEGGTCMANCTADVCDGDKIRVCNKQTGVLAAASNCTGSDSHGVYACASGACGLSGCQNGYHNEGGVCIANCTADVCDGTKIRVCNKQTGVLAAAADCTGSDSHGVYACASGACGLSGCQNGYHNEGGTCIANCTADVCDGDKIRICNKQTGVLAAAANCTGSDVNGVYTCSSGVCGLTGCASGYNLEGGVCVGKCTSDVCDGEKIRVCDLGTGKLGEAESCTGSDPNAVYACDSNACGFSACITSYALSTNNSCTNLAASFVSLNNGSAYAQINESTFKAGQISNPRFVCSTDRTTAVSTWTNVTTTKNESYDPYGGNNIEYMADVSSQPDNSYCTFLFDVGANTYIAERESASWVPVVAGKDFKFSESANLWQTSGAKWKAIFAAPEKYIAGAKVTVENSPSCSGQGDKTTEASCDNTESNVGATTPSNGSCVKPTNTSWTCDINVATNPSVVGTNNQSINKSGYLTVGANKWPTSVDFSSKYIKYTFSASDTASLYGKSKMRARFDCAQNTAKAPTNVSVAFFNGDTQLGTAHNNTISTTASECVSEEVDISNLTNLNLRIQGWDAAGLSAAIRVYPITIEAM